MKKKVRQPLRKKSKKDIYKCPFWTFEKAYRQKHVFFHLRPLCSKSRFFIFQFVTINFSLFLTI